MGTYRDLFQAPEFTPLFATAAVQVAATTLSGLALGTLVYAATRSPLLAALSMFGSSLAQVIGAAALLSASDRLPPCAAMTGLALVFGLGTAVLAVPGLPDWALFAIILGLGLAASLGGGVRYGLLSEILPADGYLLGRSVLNMSVGIMQICGFALGGLLVTALSARGAAGRRSPFTSPQPASPGGAWPGAARAPLPRARPRRRRWRCWPWTQWRSPWPWRLACGPAGASPCCGTFSRPASRAESAVWLGDRAPLNDEPVQAVAKCINRRLNEIVSNGLRGLRFGGADQRAGNLREVLRLIESDLLGLGI